MRLCSTHNVKMRLRAAVVRARGGWRILTFYQCPRRGCAAMRTNKRGAGSPVFKLKALAAREAAKINGYPNT